MAERLIKPEVKAMVDILQQDIAYCHERMTKEDNVQFWRRTFCRDVFAFVEGYTSMMRTVGLGLIGHHYLTNGTISLTAISLLQETTYTIEKNGKTKEIDQKQNTIGSIAYTLRTVGEFVSMPAEEIKKRFSDNGWQRLQEASTIRGKLMHPKSEADLLITDEQITTVALAFNWFQKFLTRLSDLIPPHLIAP